MKRSGARDVGAAVAHEARRATDPVSLQRAVAAQLRRAVPFDLWCGLTTDPGTGSTTGGYHDDGLPPRHLPRLAELEQRDTDRDFVAIRDLVRGRLSVRTLSQATDGDLARSARYRDVLEPSGVRHEARLAFRGPDQRAWGALVLMRASDEPDFAASELAVLRAASRVVADGLRRTMLLAGSSADPDPDPDPGPGLVLCTVTDSIALQHASGAARRWLEEIDDGRYDEVPYALASLVHTAHRCPASGVHKVRLRTRRGHWLTAHAEGLGATTVAVILEATRPQELTELWCDVHRLTTREREVAALAGRGLTNREIGRELYLSPYTVQDHLKSVLAKTGTRSRSELAAALLRGMVPPRTDATTSGEIGTSRGPAS